VHDPKFAWPQTVLGNNLLGGTKQDFATFAPAADALSDLKKVPRLRDNFLLISTGYWFASGAKNKFDWFDEARWATTENNLRVYARIARRSGVIAASAGHGGVPQAGQFRRRDRVGVQHLQPEPHVQPGQPARGQP
jgi:hypothetical protein